MEKILKDINYNEFKNLSTAEKNILNEIKERILDGRSAYKQSWVDAIENSKNYTTDRVYSGTNAFNLAIIKDKFNYTSNYWLTFNQMQNLNNNLSEDKKIYLQRGSKGHKIEYFIIYDTKTEEYIKIEEFNKLEHSKKQELLNSGELKFFKKEYTVFNACCFNNIDLTMEKDNKNKSLDTVSNEVEFMKKICRSLDVKINFKKQDEAFYDYNNDSITLPEEEQFFNIEGFKSTFFHELSHATGHEKRLNRDLKNCFGTKEYAFEEVIAETSSVLLSEKFSYMQEEVLNCSADYIKAWSTLLIENPEKIIKAIKEGIEAKNYILEKSENILEYYLNNEIGIETEIEI